MERNARVILVSVFLALSLICLYLFYVWIDANHNETPVDVRLVQFSGSVSGLSIGSEVRYLGVPVGRVSSIKLTPNQAGRVDVLIGAHQPLPASEGLSAMLEGQGITGLSVIELRDRNDKYTGHDVPDGAIPGMPSVLSQLSDSAGSVTDRAAAALTRINTLLDVETIANIQLTIDKARILAGNLAAATGELQELTGSITRVSRELEKTVPDFRAVAVRLDKEVVPAVVDAGRSMQAASDAISNSLGENREELQHLMNKELPTLIGMTDDLALALRQLNETLANIKDEPGSLLYGKRVKEVEISSE